MFHSPTQTNCWEWRCYRCALWTTNPGVCPRRLPAFLSFAVIMPVIWSTFMPGRLGFIVVVMKPEFWLQVVMFTFFGHLIRPEIVFVCDFQPVGRRGVLPAHAEKLREAPHL